MRLRHEHCVDTEGELCSKEKVIHYESPYKPYQSTTSSVLRSNNKIYFSGGQWMRKGWFSVRMSQSSHNQTTAWTSNCKCCFTIQMNDYLHENQLQAPEVTLQHIYNIPWKHRQIDLLLRNDRKSLCVTLKSLSNFSDKSQLFHPTEENIGQATMCI